MAAPGGASTAPEDASLVVVAAAHPRKARTSPTPCTPREARGVHLNARMGASVAGGAGSVGAGVAQGAHAARGVALPGGERRNRRMHVADVLCLSHLRWGFVYQRPNHLMSRCAKRRRVFFVEEPLFDAPAPHLAVHRTRDGVTVLTPHLGRDAARAPKAAMRALVDRLVAEERLGRPLVWFYTPMALPYAGHVPASVTVYDCMDELSLFRGAPPDLLAHEAELFRRADLVFTGGQSLYEAKRGRHPRVHAFPSSVDAAHFARARVHRAPIPADEARIPPPRIGYFGVIDERIDLPLLARMADAHPQWQIVLVGPTAKLDPSELPRRANIHYLGAKAYEELPAHVATWDVALMPFADNESTRFISPTKTLEYLAAGRPVVSTPVRDVVRPYGKAGLVRIGAGGAFVDAVKDALAERDTTAARARQAAADAFVAQTSWDRTWGRMSALIEDASTRRHPEVETNEVAGCSTT
jgi:UDP-galactopyranose mutase